MKARVEFKLPDMWVGLFWKRGRDGCSRWSWEENRPHIFSIPRLDVWICLVPCLPLHVQFGGNEERLSFLDRWLAPYDRKKHSNL